MVNKRVAHGRRLGERRLPRSTPITADYLVGFWDGVRRERRDSERLSPDALPVAICHAVGLDPAETAGFTLRVRAGQPMQLTVVHVPRGEPGSLPARLTVRMVEARPAA